MSEPILTIEVDDSAEDLGDPVGPLATLLIGIAQAREAKAADQDDPAHQFIERLADEQDGNPRHADANDTLGRGRE